MDLITLQHYEERAKKGREIVTQIGNLKSSVICANSPSVQRVRIVGSRDVVLETQSESDFQVFTSRALIQQYEQLANAEIERLEQELAEL